VSSTTPAAGTTRRLLSLGEKFAETAATSGDAPFIRYFDQTLAYRDVDRWAEVAASGLADVGVQRGDRVAVMLQNQPEFILVLLACWRLGATVVPVNVMLKSEELRYILADSGAAVLACMTELDEAVATPAAAAASVRTIITVDERTLDAGGDPARAQSARSTTQRSNGIARLSFADLLAQHDGNSVSAAWGSGGEVASLTYTSGTTGPPKGAMNTQANFAFGAEAYRKLARLSRDDIVMGGSPLFSITGLVANIGSAIAAESSIVLSHRFDVDRVASAIADSRCTFTVMPIAAFGALLRGGAAAYDLTSLQKAYSGGAAVSPRRVKAFKEATGVYVHNVYGLTEAAGATHAVPLDAEAPVDEEAQCLSVGFPLEGTGSRVVDADDNDVPVGATGEITVSGPHVMDGYWQLEEATALALRNGHLHTGDLGRVDGDGWFYVVGRAKDQINTSGWKVWPREVEEVLQMHPAVFEAAIVGIPDEQRGEVVRGYVSLRDGASVDEQELVSFCREQLAVYKCPREVVVIDDMPKTPSGKIVKRELPR
jgi:long-chain acyl-CoA synthetase